MMGSYGSNHDTEDFAIDGIPYQRRRHGSIWIDHSGSLSLTTNVGASTGYINGPNITDAKWHHVAAVWLNRIGGVQMSMRFTVLNCDIFRLLAQPALYLDVVEIIRNRIAAIGAVTNEDVTVATFDDSNRIIGFGGYIRFGVNCTINSPVESDFSDTIMRLASRVTLGDALSVAIRDRIMQLPNFAYPIKPFGSDPIQVDTITFPESDTVGSVHLYVDGIKQLGKITYVPGDDNLVNDGQFVVAGGHKGRPLNGEAQHVRLWSRALTEAELFTVSKCGMPTAETFFGGPFPHDLHADYTLDQDLANSVSSDSNSVGSDIKSLLSAIGTARFVRGGLCGYDHCPEASPDGCPLVKNRQLNFNSTTACETFARFNFCRRASDTRGRPPLPYFDGCHRGGGDDIAEITL